MPSLPPSSAPRTIPGSLGRSLYPMRILGTTACILVAWVYVSSFGVVRAWYLFLLVVALAYPHLFRKLTRRLESREKYELGACLIDAFVLGSTVYVVGFSPIPALSLLTVALSNGMALGGVSFMCLSAVAAMIGMFAPMAFYGVHYAPRFHVLMDTLSGLFLLFYFILFAWVAYKRSILLKESREELRQQKLALEIEKKKSDSLLWALLPASVASEFERCGTVGAPCRYDEVTLVAADVHEFRSLLLRFAPAAVLAELNHCFKAFDKIVLRHGIEPLRSVGDVYFAFGGGPSPNPAHASDAVDAADEMRRFAHDRREACEASGRPGLSFRFGVHTGPAVGGVIEAQKFSFDLYGDTVVDTLAMERQGPPGEVVVSQATLDRLPSSVPVLAAGTLATREGASVGVYRLGTRAADEIGDPHAVDS